MNRNIVRKDSIWHCVSLHYENWRVFSAGQRYLHRCPPRGYVENCISLSLLQSQVEWKDDTSIHFVASIFWRCSCAFGRSCTQSRPAQSRTKKKHLKSSSINFPYLIESAKSTAIMFQDKLRVFRSVWIVAVFIWIYTVFKQHNCMAVRAAHTHTNLRSH